MILSATWAVIELGRLARFGLTGIVATLTYGGVSSAFVETGLTRPVAAAVIGYLASVMVSYFGHLHFSFRVKPDHQTFFWRFSVAAAISFPLTVLITYVVTDILGESYRLSIAAVMVMIPTINYFCNRFWVFLPGLNKNENNGRLSSGVARRPTDSP